MKHPIIDNILASERKCILIVVMLSGLFCFWKLDNRALYEWDESRYAIYGYEMMQQHDYVNYYFYGKHDVTAAKAPLYIWAITLGYRLFGFNEWGLRFFSALAGVLFFIVFFKWVKLYTNRKTAFYSSLVLITSQAIIGYHAARTGDMDGFVVLFSYLALYFFSSYLDFGKRTAIIWCGLFMGLAFYTRGTMAFILAPSLLLYTILRKKLWKSMKDIYCWAGLLVFLLIAESWHWLILRYGIQYSNPNSEIHNAWQRLLHNNLFFRFTHPGIGGTASDAFNYMFYFKVVNEVFCLWIWAGLVLGAGFLLLNIKRIGRVLRQPFYLLLVTCIGFTFIMLTAAFTKLIWFLVPVTPMIAVVITLLFIYFNRKTVWVGYGAVVIFIVMFVFQAREVNNRHPSRGTLLRDHKDLFLHASKTYWYNPHSEQDLFAYFDWYSPSLDFIGDDDLNQFADDPGAVLFGPASEVLTKFLNAHPEYKHQEEGKYVLVYR